MAKARKRRTTTVRRRRRTTARAANPRRHRRSRRRRSNPSAFVARRRTRRAAASNPHRRRRRRHHSRRRRNPSALRVGQILKDMIYGAGGAILTRTLTSVAQGFVPGMLAGSPFTGPVLQAVVAAVPVRWAGKKFLGQTQGDIMMLGGLISAGLAAADQFLPNIQGQLTGMINRTPVQVAAAPGQIGMSDVYDVGSAPYPGFADVEEVQLGEFGAY